jgi:hypothetical protein
VCFRCTCPIRSWIVRKSVPDSIRVVGLCRSVFELLSALARPGMVAAHLSPAQCRASCDVTADVAKTMIELNPDDTWKPRGVFLAKSFGVLPVW